jgi:hypothetical protein
LRNSMTGELHGVIQAAMGWEGFYLFQFCLRAVLASYADLIQEHLAQLRADRVQQAQRAVRVNCGSDAYIVSKVADEDQRICAVKPIDGRVKQL